MAHARLAQGTKGPLKARFAAVRVRVADGPPQRIGDKGMQHMQGEEVWLVGERRARDSHGLRSPRLRAVCGLRFPSADPMTKLTAIHIFPP
jgi:hypothetical protein